LSGNSDASVLRDLSVGDAILVMEKGRLKVHIPGEHRGDVSVALQREILRQAEISVGEWEQA
jgi:hypothetical protein